ncbi:MAG: hypothetical protein ACOC2U_01150 [bacterium]
MEELNEIFESYFNIVDFDLIGFIFAVHFCAVLIYIFVDYVNV